MKNELLYGTMEIQINIARTNKCNRQCYRFKFTAAGFTEMSENRVAKKNMQ